MKSCCTEIRCLEPDFFKPTKIARAETSKTQKLSEPLDEGSHRYDNRTCKHKPINRYSTRYFQCRGRKKIR